MNRHNIRKVCRLFILVLICMVLTACNKNDTSKNKTTPITKEDFKLNTIISVSIYDSQEESLLDGAMAVCDRYEKILSRTMETSELYRLNNGLLEKVEGRKNSYIVSDELAEVIKYGLYYSDLSKGAFDISVEPITSLWDFTSGAAIVPKEASLKEAVTRIGYQDIALENNTVTFLKDGMGIDLGAIAKGYIADEIKDYLIENGVKSAMINLGGNVLTVGKKPNGEAFKIGVQKPFADRNEIVASMDIEDKSVVSSGVYERYFKKDGILYHHILNPTTGYPYNNGLISVTIISPKSVDGDGLSTTCFALGLDKGTELINSLEDIDAIFITEDYNIHYTEGFYDHIKVTEVE